MPLTNQPTANVLDFGADPTGVNDSRQAFQDALDSLVENGQFLMPAGTFKLTMTGTTPEGAVTNSYIQISKSCSMIGQGELTILEIGPDPIPAGIISEVFRVMPGATVTADNFMMQGPKTVAPNSNPGFSGFDAATTALYGFHLLDVADDTALTITRLRALDKFYSVVSVDTGVSLGRHTTTVKDSYLDCHASALGVFSPDGGMRSLMCENVMFPRSGIPAIENGPLDANGKATEPAYGHTMYIHPGVRVRLRDCGIATAEQNALQEWSSGGHEGAAENSVFEDCYFGPGVKGAIYINGRQKAHFRGCELHMIGGVYCGPEVGFADCVVNCPVEAGFMEVSTVTFDACEFGPMGRVAPQGGVYSVMGGSAKRGIAPDANGLWPGANNLFVSKLTNDPKRPSIINIVGGVFEGGMAPGEDSTELICPEDGLVKMSRAEVIGRHGLNGSAGVIALKTGSTAKVEVEDTHFGVPSDQNGNVGYTCASYCAAGIAANSIVMRRCTFDDAMPYAVDSPQDVQPCPGLRATPIVSAARVQLADGFNFDEAHVSGVAAISNLVISNAMAAHPEWCVQNQMCYRGKLTLISDDGFTLAPGTGTGGIAISASQVVPAGTSVVLEHHPESCTWSVAT